MDQWINILSIPFSIVLGVFLKILADPDEPDLPVVFLLLTLVAIMISLLGGTKLINEMGFYNNIGGISLSVSTISMLGFGLSCWSAGRRRGRSDSQKFWMEHIREMNNSESETPSAPSASNSNT